MILLSQFTIKLYFIRDLLCKYHFHEGTINKTLLQFNRIKYFTQNTVPEGCHHGWRINQFLYRVTRSLLLDRNWTGLSCSTTT